MICSKCHRIIDSRKHRCLVSEEASSPAFDTSFTFDDTSSIFDTSPDVSSADTPDTSTPDFGGGDSGGGGASSDW